MEIQRTTRTAFLAMAAAAVFAACAGLPAHDHPAAGARVNGPGDPVALRESERCRMWMPAGAQGQRQSSAWSPGPGGGFSGAGNCARLQADLPPGAVLVRERSGR